MSRDDAYSPLKAVRHLDIVQATREGKSARPAHVQLILSDMCNQACGFCAYRDPTYSSSKLFYEIKPNGAGLRRDAEHPERNYNPNRMIPEEKAHEIISECMEMGVSGLQFTGGGEPTIHPHFDDLLGYTQGLGIATSLVTNGVNVGKKFEAWKERLIELSWIRFSLDAGRLETYKNIRNVPDWHFTAALEGIRALRRLRDDRGGKGPVIGVGFVVTPDNWREVVDASVLARDCGADNIRISAQFSSDDETRFAEFHRECAELCRQAETLTTESFNVVNRFGQKLDDLKQGSPDYDVCSYQTFTTYIGADLNVYRCCVLAYNERGIIGNLKGQSFKALWLAQERANEMAKFDARGCERCQFNNINKVLSYIVKKDDPAHSEFV